MCTLNLGTVIITITERAYKAKCKISEFTHGSHFAFFLATTLDFFVYPRLALVHSAWGIEGMEHGTPWVKHSHAISVLPHVHANLHMPFAELLIASTFKAHNLGEGISSEHATLYLFQM